MSCNVSAAAPLAALVYAALSSSRVQGYNIQVFLTSGIKDACLPACLSLCLPSLSLYSAVSLRFQVYKIQVFLILKVKGVCCHVSFCSDLWILLLLFIVYNVMIILQVAFHSNNPGCLVLLFLSLSDPSYHFCYYLNTKLCNRSCFGLW